jgi:UDP-glucose 4-epimerase
VRIVVTGATGNVGSAVVSRLSADPAVASIVGVARRRPDWQLPKVEWVAADISRDDIAAVVAGADAVVHLAWLIQPSRDPRAMWATNVVGTRRVIDGVARAGVPVLVAASSVGAYSPAPVGVVVDESWPTDGVPESSYSWQKALQERMLDALEARHTHCRVVRIRPALVFRREAAREIRRLFIGPFVPLGSLPVDAALRAAGRLPISFQVVHADDLAEAFRQAIVGDVAGPFNVASPGIIGRDTATGRRLAALGRPLVAAAWRAHLVPVDPGWLTLGAVAPTMSTARASGELGWQATHDAGAVLRELFQGFRDDAGFITPPLEERRLPRIANDTPAVDTDPAGHRPPPHQEDHHP